MKVFSTSIRFCLYAILFATILSVTAFSQEKNRNYEFCSNNYSYGDKSAFNELREKTIPATNNLTVDGGKNGGIQVKGSDRADILVRACVQAWGDTQDEAKSAVSKINVETGSNIRATSSTDNSNWSVSYQILVPRSTNLNLNTYNGGISISSVEGTLEFEAHNGGISLKDIAGSVKGQTQNGGLNINLSGNSWKGSGLNVETKNGAINLSLPENYAANIETGTVNGGIKSNISILNIDKNDTSWSNRTTRINKNINGGGAPIRVITTNGGVNINSANK
jgi:hypothetical protein